MSLQTAVGTLVLFGVAAVLLMAWRIIHVQTANLFKKHPPRHLYDTRQGLSGPEIREVFLKPGHHWHDYDAELNVDHFGQWEPWPVENANDPRRLFD